MNVKKLLFEIILAVFGPKDNDPVKYCELYKIEGCCHIDGLYCNFPNCKLLIEWCTK